MCIQEKLEKTLDEVEENLKHCMDSNDRAILLLAKSNVLLALQKYED